MTILFENETREEFDFSYEEVLTQVVNEAVSYEKCPYVCEVNITLTDNQGIRTINQEFRGLDIPTDVLSFPMVDYEMAGDFSHLDTLEAQNMYFNLESGELLLGDIVISVERAKEQAKEYGHSYDREMGFLFTHGMLHCLGYDHMCEEDEKVMFALQDQILDPIISRK